MKYLQNKKGFSLVFAMGLVLSISLTIIYLLEYIMPYAKDTKGIEFSSNAFYQSTTAVEEGLYYVATNNLGDETSDPLELGISGTNSSRNTDFGYDIVARGNTVPPLGEGNSEYDSDWNKLAIGEPAQLEIGGNNWNNATIHFKVPSTGVYSGYNIKSQTGGIIAWQLSSESETLNSASGSTIGGERIKSGYENAFEFSETNYKNGTTLEDEGLTYSTFYSSRCNASDEKCTLKLSVINDLILNDSSNTPVPYIEYRIDGAGNIPLRYTRIKTTGYSNGFKKDLYIKVPQQTVNEAFDFTVFQ